MAIVWTQDLATGSEEIDIQHKQIFERINSMLDACKRGEGKKEVGRLIRFLESYVKDHFGTEEEYMRIYDYPEYNSHRRLHEDFKVSLESLKKRIETEGAGVHLVIESNHLVVDWFINHIRKIDTKLGTFLKNTNPVKV